MLAQMDLLQTKFNSFQGLNIAKNSSVLCVSGVPHPTAAMVFTKKLAFYSAEAEI